MAVHADRDARMRHHAAADADVALPWPEDRIARYTARRASSSFVIDGRLDEADWRGAERSPRFVDLIGGRPGIHDTRAAVLWDDTYLYVGYWVEEPFVEATLTERDAPIYTNNDVELFIAGRDATTSSRSTPSGRSTRCSSFGSGIRVGRLRRPARIRPAAPRRKAVQRSRLHQASARAAHRLLQLGHAGARVGGQCGRDHQRQQGSRPRLDRRAADPVGSLRPLAVPDGRPLPPRDGDEWRMDFSRFNQYKEAPPATDPGAGRGARTASGIRTCRSCSRACAFQPRRGGVVPMIFGVPSSGGKGPSFSFRDNKVARGTCPIHPSIHLSATCPACGRRECRIGCSVRTAVAWRSSTRCGWACCSTGASFAARKGPPHTMTLVIAEAHSRRVEAARASASRSTKLAEPPENHRHFTALCSVDGTHRPRVRPSRRMS